VAKVRAIALAWVSQTVIDEGGRCIRDGLDAEQVADELRPMVEAIIDDLDHGWGESFA
jgi:hypothetical protein